MILSASSYVWGSVDVRFDGGETLATPANANLDTDDEIAGICFDYYQNTIGAGGNAKNASGARYSFDKFSGDPTQKLTSGGIMLRGAADYLRITVHDDFSAVALEDHTWLVEGAIVEQAGGFALG